MSTDKSEERTLKLNDDQLQTILTALDSDIYHHQKIFNSIVSVDIDKYPEMTEAYKTIIAGYLKRIANIRSLRAELSDSTTTG